MYATIFILVFNVGIYLVNVNIKYNNYTDKIRCDTRRDVIGHHLLASHYVYRSHFEFKYFRL